MENQNTSNTNAPIQSPSEVAKAMNVVPTDKSAQTFILQCAIRRKQSLVGLPGSDPNERVYKIGSSLDSITKKNLKGITGELEKMFMPAIIGVNHSDNGFQTLVNSYWGDISVFVPADDAALKPEEQGKVIRVPFTLKGRALKDKVEAATDIKVKVDLLNDALENGDARINDEKETDYILLNYCLKYNRVAKDISLVGMSPKIFFYIYNKNVATKVQLSGIELRSKAINFFTEIRGNESKVNQVLVMFDLLPTSFDDLDDKLIALDEAYNKNTYNMQKFVEMVSDKNLEIKYLITYATRKGKLTNPALSEAYYYNQVLLGKTLEEAVLFLNDTTNAEAQAIKTTLEREIKD